MSASASGSATGESSETASAVSSSVATQSSTSSYFYVASALVDSGVHHHERGEYDKALKAFHTALKTQRLTLGTDHICVAHTLGNIGAVYLKLGKLEDATLALEQSLQIKLKLRKRRAQTHAGDGANRETIVISDTLNNLGNASYLRGSYDESMSYYRRSLDESYNSDARRDDALVADTLHNIGRIHLQRGELAPGLVALTESLRLTREMNGPDHINVADTLELIGSIYLTQNSLDDAMDIFLEVVRITRSALGPTHPDLASSFYNVGMTQEAKGDLRAAWEAYSAASDVYKRAGLENSSMRADSEHHIGVKTVRRSMAKVEKMIHAVNNSRDHEEVEREETGNGAMVSVTRRWGKIQMRC